MKRYIDPMEHATQILAGVKSGVLLTTCCDGKVNTMSISWGTLGIQWGKVIFTAFVRGSRHTEPMLAKAQEFTVNIPFEPIDRNIIKVCGTQSGRDVDKIRLLGLDLEEPDVISTPGIRQLPVTLECKVLYAQQQYPEHMLSDSIRSHYPTDSTDIHADYHTAYYGEIVSAYVIE